MKTRLARGEKFYSGQKDYVCLDSRKNRVLALQPTSREVRRLSAKTPKARVGKVYMNLIRAIDYLHSRVTPGSVIMTDAGKVEITKMYRSGGAEGLNEKGELCQVDRWLLMGEIARQLVSDCPPPSQNIEPSSDEASETNDERSSAPAEKNHQGFWRGMWQKFVGPFAEES